MNLEMWVSNSSSVAPSLTDSEKLLFLVKMGGFLLFCSLPIDKNFSYDMIFSVFQILHRIIYLMIQYKPMFV